jgi:hypothetical protein
MKEGAEGFDLSLPRLHCIRACNAFASGFRFI